MGFGGLGADQQWNKMVGDVGWLGSGGLSAAQQENKHL